jgi:hypothetical protein
MRGMTGGTLSYDSVTRAGIEVHEDGGGWVRHTIYDPRPLRREGNRIGLAAVFGVIGTAAAAAPFFNIELVVYLVYAVGCWVGCGFLVRSIVRRRRYGCPPTVVEASREGLRVCYFNEGPREAAFDARSVQALCVRRTGKAGGPFHFFALDFWVNPVGFHRLNFVAEDDEAVYWMSTRICNALGLDPRAREPDHPRPAWVALNGVE